MNLFTTYTPSETDYLNPKYGITILEHPGQLFVFFTKSNLLKIELLYKMTKNSVSGVYD